MTVCKVKLAVQFSFHQCLCASRDTVFICAWRKDSNKLICVVGLLLHIVTCQFDDNYNTCYLYSAFHEHVNLSVMFTLTQTGHDTTHQV